VGWKVVKRILRSLVAATACLVSISAAADRDATDLHWKHEAGSCPHGLHAQPNGPFALFLFCEDALGSYLSVIYAAPIGAPATPAPHRWRLNDRYWHDSLWGSDVTSYAWSPDGSRLFVATGEIYGSGGLFELNLRERKSRQISPDKPVSESSPGPGFTILSLDSARSVLLVSPGGEISIAK
jgi:hypothetical protein